MEILDVLLDALLDTLKLLPWLLIIYIAIELIEHKTRLTGSNNRLNGKLGPLIGAATGLIPQCGFSVMAAKLFEQKYITVGTLLAIFLATSDEAFIILLSSGSGAVWLLPLIVLKIFVGVLAGYAADAIVKAVSGRRKPVSSSGEALDAARAEKTGCGAEILGAEADHAHGACGHDHDHEDDHDHDHDHHDREPELGHGARELFLKKAEEQEFECTSCGRVHDEKRPFRTYFLSPALHTLKVALFILAVNVILGLIIHAVSEEKFVAFMDRNLIAVHHFPGRADSQLRVQRRHHAKFFAGRHRVRFLRGGVVRQRGARICRAFEKSPGMEAESRPDRRLLPDFRAGRAGDERRVCRSVNAAERALLQANAESAGTSGTDRANRRLYPIIYGSNILVMITED